MKKALFYGALGLAAATAAMTFAVMTWLAPQPGGPSQGPLAVATYPDGPAGHGADTIQVHGQWTIEILDPDGSLVSRNQFENSLAAGGAAALADLLGRRITTGYWNILLANGLSLEEPHPCGAPCRIYEGELGRSAAGREFGNLTASSEDGELVLDGTAVVSEDSHIVIVTTSNSFCRSSLSPDTCGSSDRLFTDTITLTSKVIEPIDVAPDQRINVVVRIRFSAPFNFVPGIGPG